MLKQKCFLISWDVQERHNMQKNRYKQMAVGALLIAHYTDVTFGDVEVKSVVKNYQAFAARTSADTNGNHVL